MEQKENTGAIFKNNYKKAETHPEYKGKINVDGKEKDIALWVNKSEKGESYFSAKISEPYKPQPIAEALQSKEIDDDLPF